MYLISEFSKITNLSVKTLHYYDSEQLLIPNFRNESNGYRYYNDDNYLCAKKIIMLRNFDFNIAEIKEILQNNPTNEDLTFYLLEKSQQIELRIKQDKKRMQQIKQIVEKETIMPINQTITTPLIKKMPRQTILSTFYIGRYDAIGNYMDPLFTEAKQQTAGPIFSLLFNDTYQEKAKIQVCLPIKKTIHPKNNSLKIQLLNEQKFISVIHKGPYSKIGDSYKLLFDYAKKQNYSLSTPSREVYLKGPGKFFKGNPEKYETELLIPFVNK